MRINIGRVVLAGALAGLVMNLADLGVNVWIMGGLWGRLLAHHAVTLGTPALILLGASAFVLGVSGVWLYSATVPAYGASPGTVVRVSVTVWAVAYVVPVLALVVVEREVLLAVAFAAWGLLKTGLGLGVGTWWLRELEVGLADLRNRVGASPT